MALTMKEFAALELPKNDEWPCHDGGPDPHCPCPRCEKYYDDLGAIAEGRVSGVMSLRRAMWKYPLMPGTAFYDMPKGAELKSVAYVGGDVVVYALVDPPVNAGAPGSMISKKITAAMTGEHLEVEKLGRFIGTVVRPDGIVVHVFEGV